MIEPARLNMILEGRDKYSAVAYISASMCYPIISEAGKSLRDTPVGPLSAFIESALLECWDEVLKRRGLFLEQLQQDIAREYWRPL